MYEIYHVHMIHSDEIWYHGYYVSWTRRKGTRRSVMSRFTRPKNTGQVAHNRGGLKDRYKIKSFK
jgi:hypothetical protein